MSARAPGVPCLQLAARHGRCSMLIPVHCRWDVCIVTITTTGYGDSVPKSALGKIVGGFTMLTAVSMFSFPISIFSQSLAEVYREHRQHKTTMAAVQSRLRNQGMDRKASMSAYAARGADAIMTAGQSQDASSVQNLRQAPPNPNEPRLSTGATINFQGSIRDLASSLRNLDMAGMPPVTATAAMAAQGNPFQGRLSVAPATGASSLSLLAPAGQMPPSPLGTAVPLSIGGPNTGLPPPPPGIANIPPPLSMGGQGASPPTGFGYMRMISTSGFPYAPGTTPFAGAVGSASAKLEETAAILEQCFERCTRELEQVKSSVEDLTALLGELHHMTGRHTINARTANDSAAARVRYLENRIEQLQGDIAILTGTARTPPGLGGSLARARKASNQMTSGGVPTLGIAQSTDGNVVLVLDDEHDQHHQQQAASSLSPPAGMTRNSSVLSFRRSFLGLSGQPCDPASKSK
ncbi:hypothetical protein BC828DRAFT_66600 [Blastocladiella britannica]|nr:hypothetical protein BC828DRAFT_66600 [Blastocladiella britannica]